MGTKCKFKNGMQIFSSTPQMISAGGNILTNQQLVSSTSETAVLSETIYANTFDSTSMSFRVFIAGEISGAAGGTADCTLILNYGATDVLAIELSNLVAENDKPFKAEWTGHILTAGATGKIVCSAWASVFQATPLLFATDVALTGVTVDLTANGSLNVTADWDASSADNDVIVTHGWIELYN